MKSLSKAPRKNNLRPAKLGVPSIILYLEFLMMLYQQIVVSFD